MDKNLLKKYEEEMLRMYNSAKEKTPIAVPTVTEEPITQPTPEAIPETMPQPQPITAPQSTTQGGLIGIVTAIRRIYPIKNAKVTIFTGDYNGNMNIIDSDLTDSSGRTKEFILATPEKSLSLDEDNSVVPYSLYNMMIEADGYIKNIHINIPVFSTVTSLQESNLMLEETAGEDKGPQIYDEFQKYNL